MSITEFSFEPDPVTADLMRTFQDLMDWFNQSLVPACEQLMTAYVQTAVQTAQAMSDVLLPTISEFVHVAEQIDPLQLLSVDDCERAFRAYARHYNARHPGRRVSWRRLTRHEQRAAAWSWLAAQTP